MVEHSEQFVIAGTAQSQKEDKGPKEMAIGPGRMSENRGEGKTVNGGVCLEAC